MKTITLPPLGKSEVNQLVADTLNCELSIAQPLTKLVYQKTQGNPFFATQFLKALHDDKLISFDWEIQHWQCDIAQVKALALTDDVVEFMALQLQKLSIETQEILKLAACIGAEFDLNTLVIVSEKSARKTASALWKALQEGLVIPTTRIYKFFTQSDSEKVFKASGNPTYRFLHDRVQQAAYSLIPNEQKQQTHYHIGQLLLQQTAPEAREERIFELVNQLNYGTSLITEQTEREELAQLNLIACRKARASTAYQAAREYADTGLLLLGETAWQQQYKITLAFHELAAETGMLCGDFEQMEKFIDAVTKQTHSLVEQINVYRIRIQANTSQNKFSQAIAIALEILQQLGATLTESPTPEDIQQGFKEIRELIGDREIESLVDLPVMTDLSKLAIIQIATSVMPAAFLSNPPLFPLLIALSVKLSIEYGNTLASAYSYAAYGIILCNVLQDINMGVNFGYLGLKVISKLDNKATKPEVTSVLGLFIIHRKSHIRETLEVLQDGYTTGLEVGNIEFTGYNAINAGLNSFWCGRPLADLEKEYRAYYNSLMQLNQLTTANYCRLYWESILNLLSSDKNIIVLSDKSQPKEELLNIFLSKNDRFGVYLYHLYKMMICLVLEEFYSANISAMEVRKYLIAGAGTVGIPVFYFYDSLTALIDFDQLEQPSEVLHRVAENQTELQQNWAKYAPMNHQHKVDLVEAEKCRVLGQKAEAIELYDKAIAGAKENEFIQEEALANELAAKFYLTWGKEKFAADYMQSAYYCYAKWGAKAKVIDLEKRYPQLLTPILQQPRATDSLKETLSRGTLTSTHSATSISEALDLASLLKASQTISGEIELEKLLSSLLSILIENAGADKCVLMLLRGNHLLLEGLITVGTKPVVLQRIPVEDSQEIPLKLIYKVKHNRQTAVLINASADPTLANDPYIMSQQPYSILCSPILHQGKLLGILYLENTLVTGAFTSDRVELLNLLCAQAAISLENARLYEQSQAYSQQLEQAFDDLQQTQLQMIQSEKMSALGNLVAGVAHEINNPIGFLGGNIKPALDYIKDLFGLIDLVQQKYPQLDPEIQEEIEKIELDYIREDLLKLIGSMKTGVDRIRDISTSLRTFSRADTDRPVAFKLHEGIDSTILILKHRLKPNETRPEIEIIKNYGSIPLVECYAGQLNQVFMNLLANAIDALDESNYGRSYEEIQANPNRITISTSLEDKSVRIAIADNGTGMPSDVKQRIFDHLFTTKSVGKGTGLGLAIARQIVEKHSGTIKVNSELGQGTEFAISLPIKSNHNSHE